MDTKNKLEELHKESLQKLDDYIKLKSETGKAHQEKLHEAKNEWQVAYNKLMELLLVLEKLEI